MRAPKPARGRKIRIPDFSNRAELACGRAFETGDTSELDALIEGHKTKTAELTRKEKLTLRAYYARQPPWRRKRGEWKTHGGISKRELHALEMERLVAWMRQIKHKLKNDPAEQKRKRELIKQSGHYSIETRTIECALELMQKSPQWDRELIPSFETLRNALHGRGKKAN